MIWCNLYFHIYYYLIILLSFVLIEPDYGVGSKGQLRRVPNIFYEGFDFVAIYFVPYLIIELQRVGWQESIAVLWAAAGFQPHAISPPRPPETQCGISVPVFVPRAACI